MFGFYYAAAGLIFGFLCSSKAKKFGIYNQDWFTLGFAFNIPAYIILSIITARYEDFKTPNSAEFLNNPQF